MPRKRLREYDAGGERQAANELAGIVLADASTKAEEYAASPVPSPTDVLKGRNSENSDGKRAWVDDPAILARMDRVQALYLSGWANTRIAERLGVTEATIRADIINLCDLWVERINQNADRQKAEIAAGLREVMRRAFAAAEFDEATERAIVFGIPAGTMTCPGMGQHIIGYTDVVSPKTGKKSKRRRWCFQPHDAPMLPVASTGRGGNVQFRGSKDRTLNVARQCIMDLARLGGFITDRPEVHVELPEHVYRIEVIDGPPPALPAVDSSARMVE